MKKTLELQRNYEVKIDRDAQKDPKGFYQLYRAKAKEGIGPLKGMDGSLIEKGEEKSKELNKLLAICIYTRGARWRARGRTVF